MHVAVVHSKHAGGHHFKQHSECWRVLLDHSGLAARWDCIPSVDLLRGACCVILTKLCYTSINQDSFLQPGCTTTLSGWSQSYFCIEPAVASTFSDLEPLVQRARATVMDTPTKQKALAPVSTAAPSVPPSHAAAAELARNFIHNRRPIFRELYSQRDVTSAGESLDDMIEGERLYRQRQLASLPRPHDGAIGLAPVTVSFLGSDVRAKQPHGKGKSNLRCSCFFQFHNLIHCHGCVQVV